MSRAEGFDVMDVSTSLLNDPKVKRLAREYPDELGTGVVAYVATMAESWRAGQRVSVDDAWPAYLPLGDRAVAALQAVKLLDPRRLIPAKTWRSWFDPARERREQMRERWRRANQRRAAEHADPIGNVSADTATLPRGSRAATEATVRPTVPSESTGDSPAPRRAGAKGRRVAGTSPRQRGESPRDEGANPRANGTSPRQEREAEKRGPTRIGDVMAEATRRTTEDEPERMPWEARAR